MILLMAVHDGRGGPKLSEPGDLTCCGPCMLGCKTAFCRGQLGLSEEQGSLCEKQRAWPALRYSWWVPCLLGVMLRADGETAGMDGIL